MMVATLFMFLSSWTVRAQLDLNRLRQQANSILGAQQVDQLVSGFQQVASNASLSFLYTTYDASVRVPNQYIIKFREDPVAKSVVKGVWDVLKSMNMTILHKFETLFHGCSVRLPGALPIELLKKLPWIESIEQGNIIFISSLVNIFHFVLYP
jgi:hypothetical protein